MRQNGRKIATTSHPELTARKAVQVQVRALKADTYTVKALGGIELTLEQIRAQFQAHWTLTRKQAGSKQDNPSQRGPYASAYSDAIVKETKAILDKAGVRKVA